MARRKRSVLERGAHRGRELEQPERVRDGRAVLADALGDVLLREREVVLEVAVRLRLLEGGEVAALHVLDEREQEMVAVRDALAHDHGNLGEAREPGRAHAALARDDPEPPALLRDEHGLENPRPPDGPRELLEAGVVEPAARLAAVRVQEIDRDGPQGRRSARPRAPRE